MIRPAALALLIALGAWAGSARAEGLGALPADAAGPSIGAAVGRVFGATLVVSGLLAVTLFALRALHRRSERAAPPWGRRGRRRITGWRSLLMPAPGAEAERLEVLERRHLGPRESVCVVRAGGEQFLIGVTASGISLLSGLARADERAGDGRPRDDAAAMAARPTPPARPEAPRPEPASFSAALERCRGRLARLSAEAVEAGARSRRG